MIPMPIKRLAGYLAILQAFFDLMELIQRIGFFPSDPALLPFSFSNFELQKCISGFMSWLPNYRMRSGTDE
jgi:hypothetical protein